MNSLVDIAAVPLLLAATGFVDLAIHSRDFAKPDVTLFVFHVEDVVE
jgi:hypothetical protein